tara:strand:- start:124 stop:618 length:495 start_codon:yes stop_codon:yes gene_type:complete
MQEYVQNKFKKKNKSASGTLPPLSPSELVGASNTKAVPEQSAVNTVTSEPTQNSEINNNTSYNINTRDFVSIKSAAERNGLSELVKLPEWPLSEILNAAKSGKYPVGTTFNIFDADGINSFHVDKWQVWESSYGTKTLVEITDKDAVARLNRMATNGRYTWITG